jgi:hypothetical protein
MTAIITLWLLSILVALVQSSRVITHLYWIRQHLRWIADKEEK